LFAAVRGKEERMDGFDRCIVGFLGLWGILLMAMLARSVQERRPIPRPVFLGWLNQIFIALFFLAGHHPAFRHAYPVAEPALWLGWAGCTIGWILSRKVSKPAV
jgi:hypothetical protein